jgi:hypothetical protein
VLKYRIALIDGIRLFSMSVIAWLRQLWSNELTCPVFGDLIQGNMWG